MPSCIRSGSTDIPASLRVLCAGGRVVGAGNSGYNPSLAGDSFWQFNAYVGYRFLQRRGQSASACSTSAM